MKLSKTLCTCGHHEVNHELVREKARRRRVRLRCQAGYWPVGHCNCRRYRNRWEQPSDLDGVENARTP